MIQPLSCLSLWTVDSARRRTTVNTYNSLEILAVDQKTNGTTESEAAAAQTQVACTTATRR
mgnify:CR=1 FL=1